MKRDWKRSSNEKPCEIRLKNGWTEAAVGAFRMGMTVAKARFSDSCRKALRDKRAEMSYIDSVVTMVVVMLLIVLVLNVFSFVTLKQDLSYFSTELADTASVCGCVSEEVENRFYVLCEQLGFDVSDVTYSFDGTSFMDGGDCVQYGELIYVTVSCSTEISGSGIFTLPVTVSAAASSLSERYWK